MQPFEPPDSPPVAGVDWIMFGDYDRPVRDRQVSRVPPKISGIGLVVISLIPVAFALILVIKELWN